MSTSFPADISYGQKYGPAMRITDQAEADAYLDRCIQHTMLVALIDYARADRRERENLAYYAGYYNADVRLRVEHLFHCVHPILGSIAERGPLSQEEAFHAGQRLAEGTFTKFPQPARPDPPAEFRAIRLR